MTVLTPPSEKSGIGLQRFLRVTWWNLSRSLIITRREVIDMFRDWRIIFPIVILTVIFPSLANFTAGRMMRWVEQYNATIVGEQLIPFLLLVIGFFPSSFSLIIALESFVGEKERQSLEPLLSTPLTNLQLYVGKMLSSTMPPLTGSMLGITVYLVSLYFNIGWKPPFILLLVVLIITFVQSVVMVAGSVVISSQATSVRAANLLASFIIIPMAFLIQAEAFLMFWSGYNILWYFIIGLSALSILLIRMGIQVFNREELLGRELDDLNLFKTIAQVIKTAVARRADEPRRSVWHWYREEVLHPIGRLWKEIVLIIISLTVAFFIGRSYINQFPIPEELFHTEDFQARFDDLITSLGFGGIQGVLFIVWQNVRVLAVSSVLAVISFGVLAIILLMVPLMLVGYLTPQIILAGIDPLTAWASIVPHSLFEIPAAIIAGAVAFHVGTSVIAPPAGKTVGQAWQEALTIAIRLWWTFILPLLIVGAIVEIYVTPSLVSYLLGR